MIQNDKPRVIIKNKNLQFIFDYCIESKTPFTANPRLSGDEWEIEFKISDIMGAVALGMFLRENRIEPVGLQTVKPQTVATTTTKAKATKATTSKKQEPEISEPAFNAQPEAIFNTPAATVVEETPAFETSAQGEHETADVESGGFSPEMLFDEN